MNRIGDRYRDQTRLTGHQDRVGDIAAFASLGIRALRYPLLWERVAPDRPDERDWRWSDARLAAIRRAGMQPIVGLLHHGGGPRYTSLVDAGFAGLFAEFAGAAARRYPHVEDWTPINEPLTTARFSALYGHWHPHTREEPLFWRALLNQVDATRAAMRAIRRVTPTARLIQTEDLGRYHSTPALAGVAAHFNHRRWATWDLLCGRVTRDHALWDHIAGFGFGDRLRAIAEDPCPPDIVGVNHYLTSERFLDDRPDAHPQPLPDTGYHDVAAARVLDPPAPGLGGVLREAWDRYRLPIAVTECHLGCSREEQLRWLWRSWTTCRRLVEDGVDVRALTAWALLGAVDWDSLLTIEAGHYEPGAFDVSDGDPRPTAIARLLRVLATGGTPERGAFPGLDGPGWWERDLRLEHPPFAWGGPPSDPPSGTGGRPVLILAAAGPLGEAFVRECELRGLPHEACNGEVLGDGGAGAALLLDEWTPWAVIVTDRADLDHGVLAGLCAERGVRCALVPTGGTERAGGVDQGAALMIRAAERASSTASASPAFVRGLARLCLDFLVDDARGEWRVAEVSGEPVLRSAAEPASPRLARQVAA